MKLKLTLPVAVCLMLLTVSLCTGSQLFLLLSILVLLTLAGAVIAVLWASATLEVEGELSGEAVRRGDDLILFLRLRHRGLIPIAPLLLELSDPAGNRDREIRLKNQPYRTQSIRLPVHTAHVGVFTVGLYACTVEDLLGIVGRRIPLKKTSFELVVLPQTFDVEPLKLAPGDPGSELMARATEDLSAPSDIRSYQPGDAMKKIHWKLSLRKRELMVRKFDEPILQDVLILMDCSRPPSWGIRRQEPISVTRFWRPPPPCLRHRNLPTIRSVCRSQETILWMSTKAWAFRLPLIICPVSILPPQTVLSVCSLSRAAVSAKSAAL